MGIVRRKVGIDNQSWSEGDMENSTSSRLPPSSGWLGLGCRQLRSCLVGGFGIGVNECGDGGVVGIGESEEGLDRDVPLSPLDLPVAAVDDAVGCHVLLSHPGNPASPINMTMSKPQYAVVTKNDNTERLHNTVGYLCADTLVGRTRYRRCGQPSHNSAWQCRSPWLHALPCGLAVPHTDRAINW